MGGGRIHRWPVQFAELHAGIGGHKLGWRRSDLELRIGGLLQREELVQQLRLVRVVLGEAVEVAGALLPEVLHDAAVALPAVGLIVWGPSAWEGSPGWSLTPSCGSWLPLLWLGWNRKAVTIMSSVQSVLTPRIAR